MEAPKFACDRMLGRLARWLRLLGADVLYDQSLGGGELLTVARDEHRVLLTRDKRLRTASEALWIESNFFREQLREVLSRFPFDVRDRALTRCSRCNLPLRRVSAAVLRRRVPPFVLASHQRFAQCDGCGRVYWAATHPQRIFRELESMRL